jgi:hypothetical protein
MSWSCFVEIVDVVSKIATTIIAGWGACIAYRTLLKIPSQEAEPTSAKTPKDGAELPNEAVVFATSDQTTTLRATDKGLECHLEDNRSGKESGLQWILSKEQSKKVLSTHDYRGYPSYKLYTGVFSIGPRRNWLYSKKIYSEPEILELELKRLLEIAST